MKNKIMVALDVPDGRQALRLRNQLIDHVGWLKVGLRLFVAEGPSLIRQLAEHHRIFLDLKFHDIPNTVRQAVESAGRLGVNMVNVHASGGEAMLRAASTAASEFPDMSLIAVTVLTSSTEDEKTREKVLHAAALTAECGLDGVVCSAREIAAIKAQQGQAFITVTPGIRWGNQPLQDQVRVATPADAIRMGTDYMVIGRPIIQADDPTAAADEVVRMVSTATTQSNAIATPSKG